MMKYLFCLLFFFCSWAQGQSNPYASIQKDLARGWNTWNTNSPLCHVLMPVGLSVQLNLIQRHFNQQKYLHDVQINNKPQKHEALVKPMLHAFDGSYTELELRWEQAHIKIETASDQNQWFMLITRLTPTKDSVVLQLESGFLWNKPGSVERKGNQISASFGTEIVNFYCAHTPITEYFTKSNNPFLAVYLKNANAFSTLPNQSIEDVQKVIALKRKQWLASQEKFGKAATLYEGMSACLAWNTIYDIKKERVITTVDREWNVNRGGYVFFGWDNFFLAYMSAFGSKNLAFANAIEALNEATEEGFISNNSQGNGRKAWDRSQPPVGAMMCWEIYKKHPEKWFIELVYPQLLRWNRWWLKRRMNGNLLTWGSHKAQNPFNDRRHNDSLAAWLESGIDDSPMFEGIAFDKQKGILAMQDVGLNALYIGDCEALAKMATLLGKKEDLVMLTQETQRFKKEIQKLWNPVTGIFQNYRTDLRAFSPKLSPTLFYPMIAKTASEKQAKTMIEQHFYNPEEFWGPYILPSIARNDPQFYKQKYWKGAVWAPMNFLVYLGLRNYPALEKARKDLVASGAAMFEKQWVENKFVAENYSAITGTGDDPRLQSSGWYAWGGLMAAIALMENELVSK